jgi:ABC-type Fe3+ transport system substrate-binding protein
MFLGAKAPHGNAARLFIDYALSKEKQKQLVGFQRIPVHEEVDPEPACLFKGYKRIVEGPEDYENYSEVIKLYQDILSIR